MKLQEKFARVETEINASILEREDEVRMLLGCAIAKQHIFLAGEPGVAKSLLASAFSKCLGVRFFSILMNKSTEPSDVFGSPNMKQYAETGIKSVPGVVDGPNGKHYFMQESDVVFLDEGFKSNSVVLNAMLRLLNEREFIDDNGPRKSPLRLCVLASNEMPERGQVDAFFDRFLVRMMVNPVESDESFNAIMDETLPPPPSKGLYLSDLDTAHTEAMSIKRSDDNINGLLQIRSDLRKERILVSDRRFAASVKLMKAMAWLDGSSEVTGGHLSVLNNVCWSDPLQIPTVQAVIERSMPKVDAEIRNIERVCSEQEQIIRMSSTKKTKAETQETLGASCDVLDDLQVDVESLMSKHPNHKGLLAMSNRIQSAKKMAEQESIKAFRGGK